MKQSLKPLTPSSTFLRCLAESHGEGEIERPHPEFGDYYPIKNNDSDLVLIEIENNFPDTSDDPLSARLVRKDNGEVLDNGIYDMHAYEFYFPNISPSEKYFDRQTALDIGSEIVRTGAVSPAGV